MTSFPKTPARWRNHSEEESPRDSRQIRKDGLSSLNSILAQKSRSINCKFGLHYNKIGSPKLFSRQAIQVYPLSMKVAVFCFFLAALAASADSFVVLENHHPFDWTCLLYTSDAADDLLC